jgi:hypothetical protein
MQNWEMLVALSMSPVAKAFIGAFARAPIVAVFVQPSFLRHPAFA